MIFPQIIHFHSQYFFSAWNIPSNIGYQYFFCVCVFSNWKLSTDILIFIQTNNQTCQHHSKTQAKKVSMPLSCVSYRRSTIGRAILEEIGQAIFRKTNDVTECAIFFMIAGNMSTLRNLAATDQTISGRKYFKFITGYDFGSDRGRQAASKNAYSLLSKKKFNIAASFFLLADLPILKTALETRFTKSEDLDLAFMVAGISCSNQEPTTYPTIKSTFTHIHLYLMMMNRETPLIFEPIVQTSSMWRKFHLVTRQMSKLN